MPPPRFWARDHLANKYRSSWARPLSNQPFVADWRVSFSSRRALGSAFSPSPSPSPPTAAAGSLEAGAAQSARAGAVPKY